MRSNMRFTPAANSACGSGLAVRPAGPVTGAASVQRREVVRDLMELVRREGVERRHDAGAGSKRAEDPVAGDPGRDVTQVRAEGAAVVPDLVAREAAGLSDDLLARLHRWGSGLLDVARRPGVRALVGEECHRDDR